MKALKHKDDEVTDATDIEDAKTVDTVNLYPAISQNMATYHSYLNTLSNTLVEKLSARKMKNSSSSHYFQLCNYMGGQPSAIRFIDLLQDDILIRSDAMKTINLLSYARQIGSPKNLYTGVTNSIRPEKNQSATFKHQDYFIDNFSVMIKNEKDNLTEFEGRAITGADLSSARPGSWFNGSLINFYSALIGSKKFNDIARKYYPEVLKQSEFHIFNTFFCTSLNELMIVKQIKSEDFVGTPRMKKEKTKKLIWAEKERCLLKFAKKVRYITIKKTFDITKSNYLIIPFNDKNIHWKLFVIKNFKSCYDELVSFIMRSKSGISGDQLIDFKFKKKMYCFGLDSFSNEDKDYNYSRVLKRAINTIVLELLSTHEGLQLNILTKIFTKNNFELVIIEVPQQPNDYDCGPALIHNIELTVLRSKFLLDETKRNKSTVYNFDIMEWKRAWIIKTISTLIKDGDLLVS